MPSLEATLTTLTQAFARDVVLAVRAGSLDELNLSRPRSAPAMSARPDAKPSLHGVSGAAAIAQAVNEIADEYRLHPREIAILKLAVRGATREAICVALRTNQNTLKTQARLLLRKFGVESLADAAIVVLHRAAGSRAISFPVPPYRAASSR